MINTYYCTLFLSFVAIFPAEPTFVHRPSLHFPQFFVDSLSSFAYPSLFHARLKIQMKMSNGKHYVCMYVCVCMCVLFVSTVIRISHAKTAYVLLWCAVHDCGNQ